MASESLLQQVPVSSAHVFRMRGEDPPPQAARDYEKEMTHVFGSGIPWPAFDLVFLGLGPDGHTASLMPQTSALTPGERWVVGNVIRSLQTVRITLTLPVFNHAHHVWFLVTGAKKSMAFARAQEEPNPDWPASLVRPEEGELRWYVDKAVTEPSAVSPSPRAI
jgi:6-phosphogluconolactonase